MSRYFAFDKTTGKFGDIVWRKQMVDPSDRKSYRYLVSVGDRLVGEVWDLGLRGWTGIAHGDSEELLGLRSMGGFRTRWYATNYILEIAVQEPREQLQRGG